MAYELIALDVNNEEHIKFTYVVLQERERTKNKWCIENFQLPTLQQHRDLLKKFPFICYYILSYKGIMYGVQFVDKQNKYAIYYVTKQVKSIIKKFGNDVDVRDRSKHFIILKMLLEKHPEISELTAEINVNNTISFYGALKLGFKPLYNVLTFKR